MTAYRMTRTVTLEDPAELHQWWESEGPHEVDYDQDAALELLLGDPHLTALELASMGLLSFGEVSVEREEEG